MEFHKGLPYAAVGWNSLASGEFRRPVIPSAGRLRHRVNRVGKPVRQLLTRETHEHDIDKLAPNWILSVVLVHAAGEGDPIGPWPAV
jgi:hypothetical protein